MDDPNTLVCLRRAVKSGWQVSPVQKKEKRSP